MKRLITFFVSDSAKKNAELTSVYAKGAREPCHQRFLGQTAGGQVPLPTISQGNQFPSSILYTRPIPTAPTTAATEQPLFNLSDYARGKVPPVSVFSAYVGDSKSRAAAGSQPGSQVTTGPPDLDFYCNYPL